MALLTFSANAFGSGAASKAPSQQSPKATD